MPFATTSSRNLFPTPFIVSAFSPDEVASLNQQLSDLVLQREQQTPGRSVSNVGGWQSDASILDWGGTAVRQVVDSMLQVLDTVTLRIEGGQYKPGAPEWKINGWANINRHGHTNIAHDHPAAYWSGVYYVQTDESADQGGQLELLDPRGRLPVFYAPQLRIGVKGCLTAGMSEFYQPRAGECVLFPSWLQHAVTRYTGNGTRISLAFNFSI